MPENSNIKAMLSSGDVTYSPAFSPPIITCTMVTIPYGSLYMLYKMRDDVKLRSTIRELLNDEVATSLGNDFAPA